MNTTPADGENLQGKVVLLSSEFFHGSERQRLFRAEDGFGCMPFCSGKAVFGKFLEDGAVGRIERWQIEGIVAEEDVASASAELDAESKKLLEKRRKAFGLTSP